MLWLVLVLLGGCTRCECEQGHATVSSLFGAPSQEATADCVARCQVQPDGTDDEEFDAPSGVDGGA